MKKLLVFALMLIIAGMGSAVQAARVLYDDTHAQTAGNADWIPSGAYSEMCDMLEDNGFSVDILSEASTDGKFSIEVLSNYQAIILAEPNNPYTEDEIKAIVEFVKNGGGAFIIGDHGNADRNKNGWDAVKIFNVFCPQFGFKFTGNDLYEAPVAGRLNNNHPVMHGVKAIGCWAGSTFDILNSPDAKVVSLLDSRVFKAPYILASEFGKGKIVAIGDSSPFDDGVGSGGNNKLHDSYDSFMYSHPQFAYNSMVWVTNQKIGKRIPSRVVAYHNEAKIEEKAINILIDAAHGNAASDKMATFDKHMQKQGFKVYYTLQLLRPEMLEKFATVIIPDPSLRFTDAEAKALEEWFMPGGNLIMGGSWDSSKLRGTNSLNYLLAKIGSVMRFNDDQVRDNRNNSNRPWGLLSRTFKPNHPVTKGIDTVIAWGTCSLINRRKEPLTEEAGVDIIMTGNPTSYNFDGNKKFPAVMYPKDMPIPIAAIEEIVHGKLVLLGCCNFTDYQYPDSALNAAKPGPQPFEHQTPQFFNNLMKYLMTPDNTRMRQR